MFRDMKSAFGQTGNTTTFGGGGFTSGTSSTPFGQTTFGKTTTSGFTTPAFGSTGTSLFGSSTSTAGGLFGGASAAPVFGQAQTTQPSAFGFATNTTGNSLFGSQQNANTSLFGGTTGSAFGQNKPAFGGFGTSSSGLFGQQQQPQATSSLFGQPSATTSTGIFGSGVSGFGSSTPTAAAVGTPMKFIPVTGTDTMVKSGVTQTINTRHHCITCMKEYEAKSLEELRLEDYVANRKGPQPSQPGGLFGASTQPSIFGSASTSASGGGLFQDKLLFSGGTSMGFGGGTGVFGSTNQQPGGLFGKPAGFGAVTTTTASGFSFNTTTTANPFGASTQPKPFGTVAPQANTLFGATSTQPSSFGGQSSGFGSFGNQPNQSIGLFGQNKTPFNMATTSTGFSFGQNTATNQTSSLFAKPTGTPGFGSFGATTTPGFGSSGMFNTNQNTSLFNQSFKPNTTGFSFGQTTPATSGLGTSLNLGGQSLFGQTSKPGGLFGTNTGMFGSGGTFGTSNSFGTGSGLGTSLALGGNPLLGGTGTTAQANPQGNVSVHEQILALASMPFGDTPLFRNLLPATGKTDELLKPSIPATQKAVLSNNQFKVSPRGTSKLKVKPLPPNQLTKKSLFIGLEEDIPQLDKFVPCSSTKRLVLKAKPPTPLLEPLSNGELENVPSSFPEADKENASANKWHFRTVDVPVEKNDEQKSSDGPSTSRNEGEVETTLSNMKPQRMARTSLNNDIKEVSNASSSTSEESQTSEDFGATREEQKSHPTGIVLTRVGYYTIPSLDELTSLMAEDGSCIVGNFTIGRHNYGNVFFPDPFDVSGLNLDELVHFRHKEIVLYPDDEKKPNVGEGLNRRAQVTLDRVWPVDKSTHEPITDPDRLSEMKYEDKLRRVCAKLKARFLEYRPQTGSWVFKVDHFSKYGLSDSDEDDVPVSAIKQLRPGTTLQHLQPGVMKPPEQTNGKPHGLVGALLTEDMVRSKTGLVPVMLEDDQDMEEGLRRSAVLALDESVDDIDMFHQSPTGQLARELGHSSHNVQLMKASFFMSDDIQSDADYMDLAQCHEDKLVEDNGDLDEQGMDSIHNVFSIFRTRFASQAHGQMRTPVSIRDVGKSPPDSLDMVESIVPLAVEPPVEHPLTVVLQHPGQVLPLNSTSSGTLHSDCLADLSLFRGRSFRVGWGPSGTLATLTTQQAAGVQPLQADLSGLGAYVSGRAPSDLSPPIVQRLQICGGDSAYGETFSESVEGHLEVQLEHSLTTGDHSCPGWIPREGTDALHAHCHLAQELCALGTYSRQVWELCVALWGNLPSLEEDKEAISHHAVIVRREAVSNWLKTVVQTKVNHETAQVLGTNGNLEHHIPAVLSYLSSRSLQKACEQAQTCNDHYAAMLMAQIGGGQTVRELVQHQLSDWQNIGADVHVERDRLKLFMLTAGIPVFGSAHGTVNVCENFDWKRVFALHLWYICSPVASITDALLQYEAAFSSTEPKNTYACRPDPPYVDEGTETESSSGQVFDLCFHLLKLFSSRSHSLEKLLNPATHTLDPLDYRLSWLLHVVLSALGYRHASPFSMASLHVNFALQLEGQGLWHWAIFILLHLDNLESRRAAVLEMLGRHVELSESERYLDKEDFLIQKLHIPRQWIFQAKATLATVQKEYCKAAWYFIKSGQLNEGHEVIMKYISSNAVINENYDYLNHLLEPLKVVTPSEHISGWNSGGQILWDYLQIVNAVKQLLAHPEVVSTYQLERLQPQLSSLCTRISSLPCPTARDRLCQSEIALRTAHLVRNVLLLRKGEDLVSSRVLALLVTQLPLPEDYAREMLNQVVQKFLSELISH